MRAIARRLRANGMCGGAVEATRVRAYAQRRHVHIGVDRFLQQDPAAAIIAECGMATALVCIAAKFTTGARVESRTSAVRS